MSHEDNIILPTDGAGFDRQEPKSGLIAIFTVISIVSLVLIVGGMQAYFEHIREREIYEKVLAPVGEDLLALRAREETQLRSYGYINKDKGQVRLPMDRAIDLVVKEFEEGKSRYQTAPTPIKTPDAVMAPAPGTSGAPVSSTPNVVGKAK